MAHKIHLEAQQVKVLGEQIGYGNMMALASALWRKSLKEQGISVDGAFMPTVRMAINPEWLFENEIEMYDEIVKDV
jgi:hypothetical protein